MLFRSDHNPLWNEIMDRTTGAYLKMFDVVEINCNKSQAMWQGNQAFSTAFQLFIAKKTAARALIPNEVFTGALETVGKQKLRKELLILGGVLSAGLEAYAASIEDEDLRVLVHYSPTDFKKAKQLVLVGMAEKLKNLAAEKLAALPPYGITQQTIDRVEVLIADFNKADEAQKHAKKASKKNTASIKKLVKEALEILNRRLDLCASIVMVEQPDFEFIYFHARKLEILGRRHLALMMKIVDDVTGAPVPNAVVEIHPEKIKRKASKLGNLQIRNLREGKQLIIITAECYETQTLEREFTMEHKLRVEVRMVKGE